MKDQTTNAATSNPANRKDHPLEERSFQQLADVPIKATYKGSAQGQTSHIPYRSSKPSQTAPDIRSDEQRGRTTEDVAASSFIRRYGWLRFPLIAALILYSLYAAFTGWIIPQATALSDQWHYGDARVSHTTMTINGTVRDLLGIGYKGQVEVIVLPAPKDSHAQPQIYLDSQPFPDTRSRTVILHPTFVNLGDHYEDIVVEIEGTDGVSPVLYGRADGTFQWIITP